jgi:hypothetical protein
MSIAIKNDSPDILGISHRFKCNAVVLEGGWSKTCTSGI